MQTTSSDTQRQAGTSSAGLAVATAEPDAVATRTADENVQCSINSVSQNGTPENFRSILFEASDSENIKAEPPDFFHDLNLDQIVDAITAEREEYNLKPFFYTRLTQLAAITYRQEIMRDLEDATLLENIKSFSNQMREVRTHLAAAQNWQYKHAKERWRLDAVKTYCEAVMGLRHDLERGHPAARGMKHFGNFLARHVESEPFKVLFLSAKEVRDGLSAIRYCVLLRGGSVTVCPYDSEIDYTTAVEETFAKFKQGAAKSYLVKTTKFPA